MDIISDGESDNAPPPSPKRRADRRQRAVAQTLGPLILVLIVCDTSKGYWNQAPFQGDAATHGHIVGLGLTRWELHRHTSLPLEWLAKLDRLRSRAQGFIGSVLYPVIEFASLEEPVSLPPETPARQRIQLICSKLASAFDWDTSTQAACRPLHEWVELWTQKHDIKKAPRTCSLLLHANMIASLTNNPMAFHLVGVSQRICRKRLIQSRDPSRKLLRSWIKTNSGQQLRRNHRRHRALRRRKLWNTLHEIRMTLEWLDASLEIRNTRNVWKAAQKFAKVFAAANDISTAAILGVIRPANMQVLRAARPKVDAVACSLFRKVWSRLVPDTIDVFLYLDSSPQIRGEELFALSVELRDPAGNFPWERRLAPLVALQKDYFDAVGKGLALVWILWLLVGPAAEQLIRFCDRVRCVVTDMGTERKIARLPCLIADFYEIMLEVKVHVPCRLYLFPIAVSSPGWMHGWDVVMQRGLSSLSFFPVFFDRHQGCGCIFSE